MVIIEFLFNSSSNNILILSFGSNVKSIERPFNGNVNPFKGFEVSANNNYFKTNSDGTMLLNKAGDTVVWGTSTSGLTLSDDITKIGKGAFEGCGKLLVDSNYNSINFSLNKAEIVEEYAFYNITMSSSQTIVITENVKAIGKNVLGNSGYFSFENATAGNYWYTTEDRSIWESEDITQMTDTTIDGTGTMDATSLKELICASSNPKYVRRQ